MAMIMNPEKFISKDNTWYEEKVNYRPKPN